MTVSVNHIPKKKISRKIPDELGSEWSCIIQFKWTPNRTIESATVLVRRPICVETKTEVMEYFERGHSVAPAYHNFCFTKRETSVITRTLCFQIVTFAKKI